MSEYFIQKLFIKDVRGIRDFEIPLSETERKHLVFTGKNGVGKTSVLLAIDRLLNKLINNEFVQIEQFRKNMQSLQNNIILLKRNIESYQKQRQTQLEQKNSLLGNELAKAQIEQLEANIQSYNANILNEERNIKANEDNIKSYQLRIEDFSKIIEIIFSNQSEIYQNIVNGKFILAFFAAKRENTPIVPQAIQKVPLSEKYNTGTNNLHKQFIQYMTKLRMDMLDAAKDGEELEAKKIENWFNNFETSLRRLFQEEDLKLKYYRGELNFKIEYGGNSFALNELSDGYSSLLAVVTELILRMEAHSVKAYDMQGVVLIDEVETHLHVELQKRVLPFLVDFFPKIQFIVTTHSPFVLSSVSNAVICDLEKRIVTTDLSSYSYDALVESYFDSDKYSQELKDRIAIFEGLLNKESLNETEKEAFASLKRYFKSLPTFRADELAVKINGILIDAMTKGL